MGWRLDNGDCLEVLRAATGDSVDSIVTDPPAGIDFMHRDWDCFRRRHNPNDVGRDNVMGRMSAHAPHSYGESDRGNFIAFMTEVMGECYRVLKPGGHGLIWAIPRTSHWTAMALEDAGFEIRDVITHHFGSGFPKSQDVGKFIDKLAGAERKVVGKRTQAFGLSSELGWNANSLSRSPVTIEDTAPATDEAKQWDGWGTSLKPATEHWILVRKPLAETSIARNVLKHGTGALNIDACRVTRDAEDVPGWHKTGAKGSTGYRGEDTFAIRDMTAEEIQERCGDKGRWPTNLLLSHDETCGFEDGQCHPDCPVAEVDRQSGFSSEKSRLMRKTAQTTSTGLTMGKGWNDHQTVVHGDSGGASRYFPTFHYFAKPSRREREAGLEREPTRTLNRVNPGGLENEPRFAPIAVKNHHPTVKGKKLMAWLITLVTPPKGTVLDPFAGSGSTGVAAIEKGFAFWGIEKDSDYFQIAEKRLEFACLEAAGQQTLFDEDEL